MFGRFFETLVVEVPLNGIANHAIVGNAAISDPDKQVSIFSPIALEVLVVTVDFDQCPGRDREVRSKQVQDAIPLEDPRDPRGCVHPHGSQDVLRFTAPSGSDKLPRQPIGESINVSGMDLGGDFGTKIDPPSHEQERLEAHALMGTMVILDKAGVNDDIMIETDQDRMPVGIEIPEYGVVDPGLAIPLVRMPVVVDEEGQLALESLDQVPRGIARSIIGNEHVEGTIGLPSQRKKAQLETLRVVVGGDHHRDLPFSGHEDFDPPSPVLFL